ncbi:hypothetical protein BN10_1510003 [Phycicoccus elongatus Lp2]|uniref:Uncharacterized protein n=1 Tax=Phycicoccus elongatus Lp2 TaxID=1193181 RepID=N0E363_9MICO|nr:hypothetical protein BN10_1510003 [Phycicoccus elongatus Lp2]
MPRRISGDFQRIRFVIICQIRQRTVDDAYGVAVRAVEPSSNPVEPGVWHGSHRRMPVGPG